MKIAAAFAVMTAALSGCSNFEDLNTNPDTTSKVNSSLIATGLISSMVTSANSNGSVFFQKQLFWSEGKPYTVQYNWLSNTDFNDIRKLTNAQKMVESASEEMKDPYTGLYYFLKGWYFWRATMEVGDMPYSQALDINEYKYPQYDSQKDVFAGILKDLELADQYFAKSTKAFTGDPFYGGDPVKWRKATNVVRLKVLMSLQKRAEDTPDLKVKETFQKVYQEGNLFTSNDDNLQAEYAESPYANQNPLHSETHSKSNDTYWGAGKMLVDPFKEYKDIRLFYYFSPAQALSDPYYYEKAKAEGVIPADQPLLTAQDFDAYNGMDVAGVYSEETKIYANNLHSKTNEIYRWSYSGVPSIRLGYADMNIVLAEAAERGWINASAKEFYDKAVRASFEFIRKYYTKFTYKGTEYDPTHGVPITDEYINAYLAAPSKTAYAVDGTQTDRLHQIWMQSYLASFFHLAYDEFFNFRRTGYPEWPVNPDSNLNDDEPTKIPVRWLYPTDEYNYNDENRVAAINTQGWGAGETINDIMWVIK